MRAIATEEWLNYARHGGVHLFNRKMTRRSYTEQDGLRA